MAPDSTRSAQRTTPKDAKPHHPLWIDTAGELDRFLGSVSNVREVALDTEGASFHRFVDRIYLLQLSTRELTAVIDPLAVGRPERLGVLLEDPKVEKVLHDADYDLRLLHQDYGWHARNVFDTRIAAQLLGLTAFGLAALLDRYFGVRLDKKHQRADWSMRPLTPGMLDYAAQDTMYLLELRDRMRDDLERAGRWDWAREEFQRLEGLRWEDEDASALFLRVKGARDLSRRELARLRELVQWRDRVAAELDRATFRVVGNEVLLEAARRSPRTLSELLEIKGVPRALAERRGGELLEALKRGDAVREADLPKFPRAQRWDRDADFEENVTRLKRVRDEAAKRLSIDPGVLCSRDRLEAVARRKPGTLADLSELKDLRRWQIEVLGTEFLRAIKPGQGPRARGQGEGQG
ncbi:MAG TPA: HRDC domain-containing protein [Gemmatimonadaceae bacterium]|nr:HRDC domain-containing protein [Gemmatimonadaceae bacterium]